jgi:hypothetical protein
MARYRKRPVVIEATQWHRNGDHPQDHARDREGLERGVMRTFKAADCKAMDWEGDVVRRFRRPDVEGATACRECGKTMHVHGWIDTTEGGHIVCPGDFIITGVKGERYPCKPDVFAATYESVQPEQLHDGHAPLLSLPVHDPARLPHYPPM